MPPVRSATAPNHRPRPARAVPRPRRVVRRSAIDRVRWDRLGRTALLVLLVIVAGVYVQDILSYLSARGQADQQSATVKRLTRENTQLTREQHTLEDPTTVVLEARALGMVRPGERPYVVTGLPQR